MTRTLLLLILILLFPAWAQTPSAGPSPSRPNRVDPEQRQRPEDPAHQELRDLRAHMQAAMNSGDVEALLVGVTDDVVFSTMNGDVVRGKDAIRAYFSKMMVGPEAIVSSLSTNFEADDLTQLYGGSLGEPPDAGVAFGHSQDSYVLKDGTRLEVQPRWTATMIREPDGWKIASFHYSVSIFDNPILHKMTRSIGVVGGAGVGFGLILGLLLGYLLGRRKR
jgi:ketosteroid isomerase-like protein